MVQLLQADHSKEAGAAEQQTAPEPDYGPEEWELMEVPEHWLPLAQLRVGQGSNLTDPAVHIDWNFDVYYFL